MTIATGSNILASDILAIQQAASAALTPSRGRLLVPLRNRMTKTLSSGVAYRGGVGGTSPMTYLAIIPIEAPCYAVRLGFANPFNVDMTVQKASVYPSDSYSVLAANNNAGLKSTAQSQWAPAPTGGASGCPIYFDNAGADVGTINTSGSTRNFTLAANSSNTGNVNQPFTIKWSDFIPCTSIPRADNGSRHLLFIYVTISGSGFSSGGFKSGVMNADTTANRGRYHWFGLAWNQGGDYADNPTGTTFKDWQQGINPVFAVQYLTDRPGIQVVLNGDSLSAAPTTDNFTTPLTRAGWDISMPTLPVEVASLAWGGTSSSIYEPLLRNNVDAIRPSVVAYQPLSRNDGSTSAILQTLLAKALANADTFRQTYGSGVIWNSAGCEPSFNGLTNAQNAFIDMRSRLSALTNIGPVIDGPAVLGDVLNGKPWNYFSATVSDDNTHPNSVGAELVVPLAAAAYRAVLGL